MEEAEMRRVRGGREELVPDGEAEDAALAGGNTVKDEGGADD